VKRLSGLLKIALGSAAMLGLGSGAYAFGRMSAQIAALEADVSRLRADNESVALHLVRHELDEIEREHP
jgi:hypothetical protein